MTNQLRIPYGNDFKLRYIVTEPTYVDDQTIFEDFDLTKCTNIKVFLNCEKHDINIPLKWELEPETINVIIADVKAKTLEVGSSYGMTITGCDENGKAFRWKLAASEGFSIIDATNGAELGPTLMDFYDVNAKIGLVSPTGPQGVQGVQGTTGVQGEAGIGFGIDPNDNSYVIDRDVRFEGNITGGDYKFIQFNGPVTTSMMTNDEVRAHKLIYYNEGEEFHDVQTEIEYLYDHIAPQGDQGTQGNEGNQGSQGDQGVKGVQGEKGDQGDRGLTGSQGNQGEQGNQGMRGDKGLSGNQGDRGVKGDQGQKGDVGDQGVKGDKGLSGVQGEKGDKGVQGNQGEKGDQGMRGEKGLSGVQGEKGDKGVQGNPGVQGDQGVKGDKGVQGEKGETGSYGNQGQRGNAGPQGDKGVKGDQGNIGEKGDQGDAGIGFVDRGPYYQLDKTLYFSKGNGIIISNDNGALYLNPENLNDGTIHATDYRFNYHGHGTSIISQLDNIYSMGVQGPQGDRGADGYQGRDGANGPQGNQGVKGVQGNQGEKGAKGNDGINGSQGNQGSMGPQGNDGSVSFDDLTPEQKALLKGDQGTQGNKGDNGNQGNQGTMGAQGTSYNVVQMTQADYNQIAPGDPNTLYVIVG